MKAKVSQILSECGCKTVRSKRLVIPRGEINVDVFALDVAREPNLTIICECKLWRKRVSRIVVDAFRTVVAETGTHVGFIISSAGFQSGAMAAAQNTNVELVTW